MRGSVLRLSRQQLLAGRRSASTTAQASQQASQQAAQTATKAKETAANVANKSIEILGKAGSSFSSIASKATGRTGRLLRTIESAIPPTIYYSKVAAEMAKITFRGQKMTPPDLATFQSTFKSLMNPAYLSAVSKNAISSLRNVGAKEAAFVGVLTAEVIGFFTVGEIIGRRKLVGYRGETGHH